MDVPIMFRYDGCIKHWHKGCLEIAGLKFEFQVRDASVSNIDITEARKKLKPSVTKDRATAVLTDEEFRFFIETIQNRLLYLSSGDKIFVTPRLRGFLTKFGAKLPAEPPGERVARCL